MATPAQITANRANAQKSTGPRSVEGKSASRFNALKHGIDAASIVIPGEDPADYDSLAAAYHRAFRPETPSAASNPSRPTFTEPSSPSPLAHPSPPLSSPNLPPPNSSPASSARSPPSSAPGTAPRPHSAAPAGTLRPTLGNTSTPSVPCPLPPNWLRSRKSRKPRNPTH